MITCPFCDKLVEVAENSSHNHLYDNEPDDFICPTRVTLSGDVGYSHYYRQTNQGWFPRYTALVLPFSVNWDEGPQTINVWHWARGDHGKYYEGHGDFHEFVRIAKRFHNLRAF